MYKLGYPFLQNIPGTGFDDFDETSIERERERICTCISLTDMIFVL
jgi:hypothetical protein